MCVTVCNELWHVLSSPFELGVQFAGCHVGGRKFFGAQLLGGHGARFVDNCVCCPAFYYIVVRTGTRQTCLTIFFEAEQLTCSADRRSSRRCINNRIFYSWTGAKSRQLVAACASQLTALVERVHEHSARFGCPSTDSDELWAGAGRVAVPNHERVGALCGDTRSLCLPLPYA